MSSSTPAVSGPPAHVAAHRIAVVEGLMPFEDAHLLARLVHEHPGGPLPLPAKGFMTVAQAERLSAGGWITMAGSNEVTQPVLLRCTSEEVAQYPFQPHLDIDLVENPAVGVKAKWAVEVTEEGLHLVLGTAPSAVADEEEDDDEDEEEDDEDDEDEDRPHEGCLGDLDDVASELVGVWCDGSEREWVEWAWSKLEAKGLTTWDEDETEYAYVVARLGVLAAFVREFAAHAHGEGSPGDWAHECWNLVGDYPRVSLLALGRVAEREGLDADGDPRDHEEQIMGELVRVQRRTVVAALLDDPGQPELFASLWWTAMTTRYPISVRRYHEAVNDDVTGGKVDGFQWVEDGMPIE